MPTFETPQPIAITVDVLLGVVEMFLERRQGLLGIGLEVRALSILRLFLVNGEGVFMSRDHFVSEAMIKSWGRNTSSNVQKVMWAVGEMSLPHERIDIGGPFGKNREPAYLAMNPNGLVPTLEEEDGFLLWESNSIVRYLAAKNRAGVLEPVDPHARALASQWMDWQLSTIGPPMRALLFGLIRTRPEQRDQAASEAARRKALSAWTIVEDALGDGLWLAGASPSLAEIVLGTLVYRWHTLPIERPALKNLRGWYERMRERPGFKTHIEIPIT